MTIARSQFVPRLNGFTLLELLVVVAIIALLTSYVGPRLFGQIGKSEHEAARAQLDAMSKALDAYRIDIGNYPTTEQGLAALTIRPEKAKKWTGPYLQKPAPPDPWGLPFAYASPGRHGDYDLYTLGKDGRPGGDAENADVTSWQ